MKHYFIFCLLIACATYLCGQNLVRDGGFDNIECPNNGINSVDSTSTWYATNPDFYLIDFRCPLDPEVIKYVNALNHGNYAFRGAGYASLEASFTVNGYYQSEGVGIELTKELGSGRHYYFEMVGMNYKVVPGIDHPGTDCDPIPNRYFEIRLGEEKIYIDVERDNFLTTAVSSNSEVVAINDQIIRDNIKLYEWTFHWNCFAAKGGERHMAITGNNFKMAEENNCVQEGELGNLYHFGYGIDEVLLMELPLEIDTNLTMCPGGKYVDLHEIIDAPYADKASYIWADGFEGNRRLIRQAGSYELELILPCVRIPIRIQMEEFSCLADFYVPTAFSPNGDGVNDLLSMAIHAYYPISDYRFQVYDRWGKVVFQSSSLASFWDGFYNGKAAPEGAYAWVLEIGLQNDVGTRLRKTGSVVIIR